MKSNLKSAIPKSVRDVYERQNQTRVSVPAPMMKESDVERIKAEIHHGMRVKCLEMKDDPRPIEAGTVGTVDIVDDAGQIHVRWENGRYLALVPGVDRFEILKGE